MKKKKNPASAMIEKEQKEKEARRKKLFGKMYDTFTKGKTEKEIEDAELYYNEPSKWLKKAKKEGRVLID